MMLKLFSLLLLALIAAALGACASAGGSSGERVTWAIALHGGAGTLDKDAPAAERDAAMKGLTKALEEGKRMLASGATAMDTVEAVARILEDDPNFNAGKGAVFNADGKHELDASIMDGRTLTCGAVASLRTVRNPISLARMVMEKTRHVLLMGDGAELFADQMKVERVPNDWFDTPKRRKSLEEWKNKQMERLKQGEDLNSPLPPRAAFGTIGCVAMDSKGNLAAATSTGGMTGKKFGRIGDSPIIGAGNYASNASCAVSGTGTGEEYIRHVFARSVAARMEFGGQTLRQACHEMVFTVLKPDDGGCIAVSRTGEIVMLFNTNGMYRAAADSKGLHVVKIWE